MNVFEKVAQGIDTFQQRHKSLAFTFAVIKKYQDDQGGYQAALVTYYGFLSMFPLLLILSTIASTIAKNNPTLGRQIIDSISDYFPVVGQTLEDGLNHSARSSLTLAVGLLLSLYGARGIADAFRHAANHIWHVPLAKRSGFPRSLLRTFGLIIGGGVGFVLASVIASNTAAAGRGVGFSLLATLVNFAILYVVFLGIFRLSLPLDIERKQFRLGAAISAVMLTILQLLGGYILARITPTSYSALFATTLGLIAWIYLQARLVMYAMEIDTVRAKKLWPRSLTGQQPTAADEYIAKMHNR